MAVYTHIFMRINCHVYRFSASKWLHSAEHRRAFALLAPLRFAICLLRSQMLILRFATYQQADGYAFGLLTKPSATPLSLCATLLRLTLRRLRTTPTDTK